jgi:hypothetical protein
VEEALSALRDVQIFPTQEFRKILTSMSTGDVPFSDFILALTKYDKSQALREGVVPVPAHDLHFNLNS